MDQGHDVQHGAQPALQGLAFEREVANLLAAAGLVSEPVFDRRVDFLVHTRHGFAAVLVKLSIRADRVDELVGTLAGLRELANHLVVVYREASPTAIERLRARAHGADVATHLFTADEFAAWLHVPPTATAFGTALAMALITSNVPSELAKEIQGGSVWHRLPMDARRTAAEQDADLATFLRIGEELSELTFVMSDIEGYSTLVGKARAPDIVTAMARIYRESRNVVLRHGGFLVGFSGDSVLAVFDYPQRRLDQHERAILCAADLVGVARPVLDDLLATLNNDLTTSTRVAVTNGDALVIDAGVEAPDPQFVGDAINLAARLQAIALPDGLLIDNRTRHLLELADPAFLATLNAVRTSIPAERVKGQGTGVIAWAVDATTLKTLMAR